MRTKVLLGMAAIAAGALTAVAQSNVYSLNVVGYINLPLVEGFSMVANQLDADGTGTNNTDVGVFGTQLPGNSAVYTWNGSGYNINTYAVNAKTHTTNWTGSFPLNPGQGCWVSVPAGAYGGTTQTVTTVGQVLQGTLNNASMPAGAGFSIISDQVPLSGLVQTALGLGVQGNDAVYQWSQGTQTYVISTYAVNAKTHTTNWAPSQPSVNVGEGFWIDSANGGTTWSQTFTVH